MSADVCKTQKYIITVWVQMPDGNYERRPIAHYQNNGMCVVKKITKTDALDWAHYILPDRVDIEDYKRK